MARPGVQPGRARLLLRSHPREPDVPQEHARVQVGRSRSVRAGLRRAGRQRGWGIRRLLSRTGQRRVPRSAGPGARVDVADLVPAGRDRPGAREDSPRDGPDGSLARRPERSHGHRGARGGCLPGVAHPALAGARVDARGDGPLMARLLRAPLVHFLVLGGALLAVRGWLDPALPPRPRLVIHAADVARRAETWTEEHGAPPDTAAKQRLLDEAIDEEVLYREALARSFDRQIAR